MSKLILIVEDDQAIVESLVLLLEASGYAVQTAADGGEAFACIRKHMPDMILLDYDLPGENGDEITKKLRQDDDTKDMPVIVLSASSSAKEVCLAAGANMFIAKPYEIPMFLDTIARIVN